MKWTNKIGKTGTDGGISGVKPVINLIMHYEEMSISGWFWSVQRHKDIKQVEVFQSPAKRSCTDIFLGIYHE